MTSSPKLTPATTGATTAGETALAGKAMRGSNVSRAAAIPAKCNQAIARINAGAASRRSGRVRRPAATIAKPQSTRLPDTETTTDSASQTIRPVTT